MKMTNRFVALLMAVAICMGMMSISAFASEVPKTNDKVVVFEQVSDAGIVPYSNEYASVWVPAGQTSGSFEIQKSFTETGHVTFKARSDSKNRTVNMCVSRYQMGDLMSVTGYVTVKLDDTEYKPERVVEGHGKYYVNYEFPNGNPDGTFLMCWIYG